MKTSKMKSFLSYLFATVALLGSPTVIADFESEHLLSEDEVYASVANIVDEFNVEKFTTEQVNGNINGCTALNPPLNLDGECELIADVGFGFQVFLLRPDDTFLELSGIDYTNIRKHWDFEAIRTSIIVDDFKNNTVIPYTSLMETAKAYRYTNAAENVLLFSWSPYAVPYLYSEELLTNVGYAGEALAKFLFKLRFCRWLNPEYTQIVGFGDGAHVAGTAGRRFQEFNQNCNTGYANVGRITGISPSGFWFSNEDCTKPVNNAIRWTDATFVDVYHCNQGCQPTLGKRLTDGRYGTSAPSGDIDVYVNGGVQQPGCERFSVGSNSDIFFGCSNYKCVTLYNKSLYRRLRHINMYAKACKGNPGHRVSVGIAAHPTTERGTFCYDE